jgi:hypothetical protein
MSTQPDDSDQQPTAISLAVAASVTNEADAAMMVAALADHGIEAVSPGGYTAGFRAEAPGDVKVVVKQAELQRAREVLAKVQAENESIDWSQVDVGKPGED